SERNEEAAENFSRALRLDPNYLPARTGLAEELIHVGSYAEARQQAELAVRQHPKDAEAHFQLASVMMITGQDIEAVEHFRQVLALAPDYLGAYQELGLCLSHLHLHQQAVATYRAGLRVDPLNYSLLNNLA